MFELLFPPARRSRPKRPKCEICKAGSGCRKKGQSSIAHELECERCGHSCWCHHFGLHHPECPNDPTWNTSDYCAYSAFRGLDGQFTKCPCLGFSGLGGDGGQPKKKTIPAEVQTQMELTEPEPMTTDEDRKIAEVEAALDGEMSQKQAEQILCARYAMSLVRRCTTTNGSMTPDCQPA
jgi:hypothetical protein